MSAEKNLSNDGTDRVFLHSKIGETKYPFHGKFDVVINGEEKKFNVNIIGWRSAGIVGGLPPSWFTEYRGGMKRMPGHLRYEEFCFNFPDPLVEGEVSDVFAYYVLPDENGHQPVYTGKTIATATVGPINADKHPVPRITGKIEFTSTNPNSNYKITADFDIASKLSQS